MSVSVNGVYQFFSGQESLDAIKGVWWDIRCAWMTLEDSKHAIQVAIVMREMALDFSSAIIGVLDAVSFLGFGLEVSENVAGLGGAS